MTVILQNNTIDLSDTDCLAINPIRTNNGLVPQRWTAMRRPGVRFPVGTVHLSSFTSFARYSKRGCRLLMTSLSMGR